MEIIPCDLCGAEDTEIIFSPDSGQRLFPSGTALVRCRRCGLLYLNPRPSVKEIGAWYPADYAPYRSAIESEPSPLMRFVRRVKLERRRKLIEKYSGLKTGTILDVGCSTGLFLHEMQQHGWRALGVELISSAAEYARSLFKLDVFVGELPQAPFPPGFFDVITFWDVLEHSFSPMASLSCAARLLKPGGLLLLNIPNYHSLDRVIFGADWIGYDPPRHLYVFTRGTLSALLERNGFQPFRRLGFISSYFSFIISLESWLARHFPLLAKPVGKALNIPGVRVLFEPFFGLMNALGRGGVIAVLAFKKTS